MPDKGTFTLQSSFVQMLNNDMDRAYSALFVLVTFFYTGDVKQKMTLNQMQDVWMAAHFLGLRVTCMHLQSLMSPISY